MIILKNAAQCRKCNDIIESKHRHDFVECMCGAIHVDGGLDYLKRGGATEDFINLSEFEETEEDESKSPNFTVTSPLANHVNYRYETLELENQNLRQTISILRERLRSAILLIDNVL